MRRPFELIFFATLALSVHLDAQQTQGEPGASDSYYPAFYSAGAAFTGTPALNVFPPDGKPASIPLPFVLGRFAYALNGKALYAQSYARGVYKIEFNPIRATLIPGTQDIKEVHSIAVSAQEDRLVVSGRYRRNQRCGVFGVQLPGGLVDNIIETPDCRYVSAWLSLSLSPTAEHGVAVHERHLELIDFATKGVGTLGDGYSEASWSPDGRWIAALEWAKQRTVLLDGRDFSRRAVLGDSEVRWSPDSRFLLRVRPCRFSDSGTIEALEIASGKTVVVKSSTCEVYQPTTGWVSKSILP
jgi:hypothetical protein